MRIRQIKCHFWWSFLSVLFLLMVGACKKALDSKPYSSFAIDNFYKSAEEADMAVLGVYSAASTWAAYGWHIPMIFDNATDIGQVSGVTADADRTIPHYIGTPESSSYFATWSILYQGIDRANLVIEKIPAMTLYGNGTADEKKHLDHLLGEARFLRGFFYSELVRLWGDVPFKTSSSAVTDDPKGALVDRYTIFEQIIQDMKDAIELLPTATPINERINKWGAKAMLARVALFAGGYSLRADGQMKRPDNYKEYYKLAQQQINEVMMANPYKLNPSYPQVFINQCQHILEPAESIFEIAFFSSTGGGGESPNSSRIGLYNAPRTALGLYGATNLRCTALFPFYESFQNGDFRKDFAVARYRITAEGERTYLLSGSGDESWAPGKWSREYQTNGVTEKNNTNINYVVMRFPDLLLMRAEVENELNEGPNEIALDAINLVRRRAYGLDMPGNSIALTITSGGAGYTTDPTLQITGGGGMYASAAVARRTGNRIAEVILNNGGYGYTTVPAVTVSGGGGSGAVVTAALVSKPAATAINIPAGLSKQQFLDTLMSERAKELCFEGMRRADLIRWGILDSKIAATFATLRAVKANYPYPAGENFRKGKHELFPFPQNEMDVNSGITRQNPGW